MKNTDFAHLHVHNEFSQLDGFGTADAYAKKAAELGFKYLALTNHGNIDGLIKFQKACNDHGVKPILGCEAYIVPDVQAKSKKKGHILLLIKNQTGFKNLCNLLSFANMEGFYYKPRISSLALLQNCEGLIVSTACVQSFLRVNTDGFGLFENLYDIIGEDLYCEVMPHNFPKQIMWNRKMRKIAKRMGVKVIATNDCHYIRRTEWRTQEVLLAIQRKAQWNDRDRWRFNLKGLYLRSADEMKKAFQKIDCYRPSALLNTIEVAEKCGDFIIPKLDISLPRVDTSNVPEAKFLRELCKNGFKKRFGNSLVTNKLYYKRFFEEFNLIKQKKFIRYFLIVWELINWCRENNILVGPGRGSVGGSLIAYLIGITAVDPIEHNLLFSRFINEDRIDYPDIDIDFEYTKRHLVRRHLEELYGENNVAGVSSFNRMKAKAVVKDVARVFGVPYGEVNSFTKLLSDGEEDAIQTAIDSYEDAREFAEEHKKVIKFAKKLEGQVRGYSQHAAGVVLSKDDISKSGRCNLLQREDTLVVNWEKEDTEYVGLMKLDVLGLKLMSILAEAIRLIKENHNKNIKLESINLNDKKVLKEISRGNTVGLFQLNAYATTSLVKEMGIEKFSHICDAVALVRPGPTNSGMTTQYIKRKHGAKWEKLHKEYEEICKDTFGILVYQEQVMEVIKQIAGLPYSTADKIRKIIGKKRDRKEFNKYKREFIKGCKEVGIFDKSEAKEFWRGLEEWAKYGFNKSHSVEYALLGYWCAWLKKYYPTEFICGSLTHCAKEKKKELVEEAYRLGLSLVLPKVNISKPINWVAKNNKLYIPFIEVKGIGDKTAYKAAVTVDKKGVRKFFKKSAKNSTPHHGGKLGNILQEIGAYEAKEDAMITEKIKNYFDFRIVTNPRENYQKLYKLYKDKIRLDRLDPVLEGDYKELKTLQEIRHDIIKERSFQGHPKLHLCELCELRGECTSPVPPSPGKFNIVVCAEAPGPKEDKQGEGLVGPSGDKVWTWLRKRKLFREMFHVTNINKCYPSSSRKPNSKQAKTCGSQYLEEEIRQVKPIVILAFGNTSLEYFTGRKSGIMELSGKVQWHEYYGSWIVWSLHPAAVLHNPDNEGYFIAGMKSFAKTLRALGIKKTKEV